MNQLKIIILVSILSYIFPMTASAFDRKVQTNEMEYVEAIKEAGSLWAVPVIDLNAICGLNLFIHKT